MPENPDMKFNIMPVLEITDAMLISSNIPEIDYAAWSGATTYAAGARVIVVSTDSVYESKVAGNLNNDPVADVDPVTGIGTYWLIARATNRWQVFDKSVSEAMNTFLSFAGYTIQPGIACDTIVVFGLGSSDVDGALLDIHVNGVQVFGNFVLGGTFILTGISVGVTDQIEFNVVNTFGAGGKIVIGQICVGNSVEIGDLLTGGTVGMTDYSKKERDTFGNLVVIERGFAAKVQYEVAIPTEKSLSVYTSMAYVRARPTVYHGGELSVPYGMVQLGILNDFSISQPNMTISNLSISVDGLT